MAANKTNATGNEDLQLCLINYETMPVRPLRDARPCLTRRGGHRSLLEKSETDAS